MTMTTASVLDTRAVSEILATYLCQVDETPIDINEMADTIYAPSSGAAQLVAPQLEAANTAIHKSSSTKYGWKVCTEEIFMLGIEFGVAAAVSTLRERPDEAVAAIRRHLLKLKLQFQRGIEGEAVWRRPIDDKELDRANK